MSDEQETNTELAPSDDDLQMQSELDAILGEALDVDGGQVDESGNLIESDHDDSPTIETSELLYPIIDMSFDIFAGKWQVKQKEKKALAEAYGALLDKYFPDAGNFFGVEITALMATGMVVAPRMMNPPEEKEVNPKPKKEKPKDEVKPEFSYAMNEQPFEMGVIKLD